MPLYEADLDGLLPVSMTTFEAEGWKERGDIQRLVKERIAILEDGLLVLTDEFSGWSDSLRRIDLLCLDTKANLVVVELKRGEDGAHMELQAIRYAAMVSGMTFGLAAETLARYRAKTAPDTDAARAEMLAHLGWTGPAEAQFAKNVRIILVSADFGKELTTAVLWLRDFKVDIRCVRLRPYRLTNSKLLVEVQQLIPLPEAADYQTKLEEKKAAERKELEERTTLIERFLGQLAERATTRTKLHQGRMPNLNTAVISAPIGKANMNIAYAIARDRSRAELLIFRDDARATLFRLKADFEKDNVDVGVLLEWSDKEGVKQCRVSHPVDGGYGSPDSDWPRIHDELIAAMIKIDAVFRPRVQFLV